MNLFPSIFQNRMSVKGEIVSRNRKGAVDFRVLSARITWPSARKIKLTTERLLENVPLSTQIPFAYLISKDGRAIVRIWDQLTAPTKKQIENWIRDNAKKSKHDSVVIRIGTHRTDSDPSNLVYSLLEIIVPAGDIILKIDDDNGFAAPTLAREIIPAINSLFEEIPGLQSLDVIRLPRNKDTSFTISTHFNVPFRTFSETISGMDLNARITSEAASGGTEMRISGVDSLSEGNRLFNLVAAQFAKRSTPLITIPTKQVDLAQITDDDILSSERSLERDQVGKLPPPLSRIFDPGREKRYIRLGVGRSKNTFLKAISRGLEIGKEPDRIIRDIDDFLMRNPRTFEMLNDGELAFEFKNDPRKYIAYLNDAETVGHTAAIDVLSKMYRVNIFVLEDDGALILCESEFDVAFSKTVFVFVRRDIFSKTQYDLIARRGINGEAALNFGPDSEIVGRIQNLYEISCLTTPQFPGFSARPPTLFDLLKTDLVVEKQAVNAFNKVVFAILNGGTVLPVVPSGQVANLEIVPVENMRFNELDETLIQRLVEISKTNELPYQPVAQTLDRRGFVQHLVLESGLLLPIRDGVRLPGIPAVRSDYELEVDAVLASGEQDRDARIATIQEYEYNRQLFEQMRREISHRIRADRSTLDVLRAIISDRDTSRVQKQNAAEKLLEPIFESMRVSTRPQSRSRSHDVVCAAFKNKEECSTHSLCAFENGRCLIAPDVRLYDSFQKLITNEIVSDTKTQCILNGKTGSSNGSKQERDLKRIGKTILFDNVAD